jgi:hypothetical protein
MSVTARSAITGAMKLLGVISPVEALAPEDGADGLIMLNNIIDAWNLESLFIYTVSETVVTFSGVSATIGPAMTINVTRPVSIDSAFYRKSGNDYPLRVIDAAEYNAIDLKTVLGDPEVIYYDGNSPTGTVYVWPVPSSTEYHIQLASQLVEFATLDTVYNLPQGYRKALMYTLAVELGPLFKREASATVVRIGINIRRILKRSNVKSLAMTIQVPSNSANSGRINILSNQ